MLLSNLIALGLQCKSTTLLGNKQTDEIYKPIDAVDAGERDFPFVYKIGVFVDCGVLLRRDAFVVVKEEVTFAQNLLEGGSKL
jgi:hypothetical protein